MGHGSIMLQKRILRADEKAESKVMMELHFDSCAIPRTALTLLYRQDVYAQNAPEGAGIIKRSANREAHSHTVS